MKSTLKIFSIVLLASLATYYFTRGMPNPAFEVTDISSHIQTTREHDFTGAFLVNLDEDPELEIFIASHGSSNLFLKRQDEKFHTIEIPELVDREGHTYAVNACDLDADGRDEILMLNRPGPQGSKSVSHVMKYREGKWSDIIAGNKDLISALQWGHGSTCIDRKGNGKYGTVVTKEDGTISYLEMENGIIKDIASEIGVAYKSKGRGVLGVPGPDGLTNIFVGNEAGSNFYFVNNGDGTFEEKAVTYGLEDPNFDARGASTIDINGDEIPDLIYGNHVGPTRLMKQTREGKFIDITPELMIHEYAVNAPVVGDFNLDGYEDVYLNNSRGKNELFARNKNQWFHLKEQVMDESKMFGISSIAADLDKNGSYEILNTHGDGEHFPIKLYTIKPESKWIRFHVHFQNGGFPRGAIVKLRTNRREQVRVISPGSGRYANYDYIATFGLLKDERVISSETILPSKKRFENFHALKEMSINEIVIPDPKVPKDKLSNSDR